MNCILVAEPKWTGHHAPAARRCAELLAGSDRRVVLSLAAAAPEQTRGTIESALAGLDPRIAVRRSLSQPQRGWSSLSVADGLVEAEVLADELAAVRPDLLVLPTADAVALACGSRSTPAPRALRAAQPSGVVHQVRLGYGGNGLRWALERERVRWALWRSGFRLAAVDPRTARSGRRLGLQYLPYPGPTGELPDRASARRHLGEHGLRKGTDRVVRCWPADSAAILLVVGSCADAVKHAYRARAELLQRGALRVVDEVVDESTYVAALVAADVVTALYPRHVGVSGIVLHAACARRPVLGGTYGAVGDMMRAYGLGETVDAGSDREVAEALRRVSFADPSVDASRREALVREHSPEHVAAAWSRWIRRKDEA